MNRFIPPEIIDEIIARTDIVEVIGEYVSLKKRGRNYFGLCPFHSEDTESFAVNPDQQFYNCFGCGKGGNIINFVKDIESLSFPEAAKKLAERVGIVIPEEALSPEAQKSLDERRALYRLHEQARDFYREKLWVSQTNLGRVYLQKRGVNEDIARQFSLGYAPEAEWQCLYDYLSNNGAGRDVLNKSGLVSQSAKNGRYYDKFHGRLIFPINDYQGRTIAFGGRALGNEDAKYLNSMNTPLFNKSSQLYALDIAAAAIRATRQVIIMEGYMDVIAAHQYGVTNAVATLGTAFTVEHGKLLKRYAPDNPDKLTVYLCFDGDKAGAKAAKGGVEKLRNLDFIDVRILVLPPGDDPDDFLHREGLAGWQSLMKDFSYDILDYLLNTALEMHDVSGATGKSAVVSELLPAIAACRSRVERDSFIRDLAKKLQVAVESIYGDLRKSGLKIANPARPPVNPVAAKQPIVKRPRGMLLRLAIEDKNIFYLAKKELADNFATNQQESQLIGLIEKLGDQYDFNPPTLFNHLEGDFAGLRQFLLKLLQADIPGGEKEILARDCLKAAKLSMLQQQKEDLNNRLAQALAEGGDIRSLLIEQISLDKQLDELKG